MESLQFLDASMEFHWDSPKSVGKACAMDGGKPALSPPVKADTKQQHMEGHRRSAAKWGVASHGTEEKGLAQLGNSTNKWTAQAYALYRLWTKVTSIFHYFPYFSVKEGAFPI